MKRYLLPLITIVALLASCDSNRPANITLALADLEAGTPGMLTNRETGDTLLTFTTTSPTTTLTVDNVDEPFMGRLSITGLGRMELVIEAGDITIDAEGKVSGTPLNDKLEGYAATLNECETDEEVAAGFDRIYRDNRDNVLGKWAFAGWLLNGNISLEQAEAALAQAPADYAGEARIKGYIEDLKASAMTAVGNKFADFAVTRGGVTERLSDHVGKDGKFTLVDFWASWCGPCRREMPNLKALAAKYPERLQVIGVAVWDEPAETLKAIDELELPWHVMMGDEALKQPTDLYGIFGIPHIMLIGPDGTILSRGLQGDALTAAVDEALNAAK